jgi:uncharacterized protein
MRTSSYTIYVDLPNNPDEMLLVHGYTGAYDKVSKRVATYVRSLEARRAPKPLYGEWTAETPVSGRVEPPSDETVGVLRRRGYLTEMSMEKEQEVFHLMARKIHEHNLKGAPGYVIMPTYDCNLRCSYCFQDHMRTNPLNRHLLRSMSLEMVDRIFLGIRNLERMHGAEDGTGQRRRVIGFFGGEPLLASSKPTVQYIMEKTRGMGPASFWGISNATELDAYPDLLGPDKIARLQVTMDGVPAEHDKRRIYADGSGSWEKIKRNITMALELGVQISIRMNFDRNNLHQLPEMAGIFRDQGWDKFPGFSAYTAPIHAVNDNVDRKTTMDSWQLDLKLKEMQSEFPILEKIIGPDDSIKDRARALFEKPDTVIPPLKESFCSAHHKMYIFDAFGDLYACWERTGDSNIRVGHINQDGSLDMKEETLKLWRSRTVSTNPVCSQCRYALYCGGGCAVLAEGKTGKYHMNFCDGYASRFRSSVAEAYIDYVSGAAIVAKDSRICDQ